MERYRCKERLLIFADSRQDAAHQARFISYAGRYDRMRRRLSQALREAGGSLGIDAAARALLVLGVRYHDNPHTRSYGDPDYLPEGVQARAKAWEEAPLLDDVAVSANYRSTVLNLGLVGVRYDKLDPYVLERGAELAKTLGLSQPQLVHLCRCLLDEVRRRGAFARPILAYHPLSPNCPVTVPDFVEDLIRESTLESLNEAVRLAPTNGLAFARLAKQVLAQSDQDNPRRVGEADFFSRYALKWSPNDAEVARSRTEVEEQIEALKP